MNQLISNVLMQPNQNAVERPLTLVEKLRNRRKEWASNPHYWMDSNLIGDVFNDVIDIVKEHKCIWKGVYIYHEESTCYSLSCGNEYFDNYMGEDVDLFKYCPYCGGEIEFSEVEL